MASFPADCADSIVTIGPQPRVGVAEASSIISNLMVASSKTDAKRRERPARESGSPVGTVSVRTRWHWMPRSSYRSVPGASGVSGGALGGSGRRVACVPSGRGEEYALPTGALESVSCESWTVAPAVGGARSSSGVPKGGGIGKTGVYPSTGGFRKMRTASNSSLPETQRWRERRSRLMSRARSGARFASGAFVPGWAAVPPTPAALRTPSSV